VTVRLKSDADEVAVPAAINDRGLIVGALSENEGTEGAVANENENEQAALWQSATAQPVTLSPLPGDQGGHAFAVDDHGRVGGLSAGTTAFRAVLWDSQGAPRALPDLGGGYSAVRALADNGLAVGDSVSVDGKDHPVIWDATGRITDLGLPPGARSGVAVVVLSDGAIIGTVDLPVPGGGHRTQAARWRGPGAITPLSDTASTGSAVGGATDTTTYAGYTTDAVGAKHPAVWHCGK